MSENLGYYAAMGRAMEIFLRYEGEQYFSAEHDAIYSGPDPRRVTSEDLKELEDLGWNVDQYRGCFYYFT